MDTVTLKGTWEIIWINEKGEVVERSKKEIVGTNEGEEAILWIQLEKMRQSENQMP